MILGDEVGMGKTYEVFGVIAPLLRVSKRARVVVLAHSEEMAQTWHDRWGQFRVDNVADVRALPEGEKHSTQKDAGNRTGITTQRLC